MTHQHYMQRCFDLARHGAGTVSPNPMVGAVLVYQNKIIGEGWHRLYGNAHAEVNAVASVREEERHLIPDSTLYVSLEPCNIQGNTPPCTGLILKEGIKKVIISCIDHTPGVDGTGLELLRNNGVEVVVDVLADKGRDISAHRQVLTAQKRPFIQVKFAQSKDGFMGQPDKQVWISNFYSKRLSHKMRGELDAILVGTQTALIDNPRLDNRLWWGKHPLKILLDRQLKVPTDNYLFDGVGGTLVLTEQKAPEQVKEGVQYFETAFDDGFLYRLMDLLVSKGIGSLLVEGGARTIQHFLDKNLWDEAWVFTNNKLLETGIVAPTCGGMIKADYTLGTDQLVVWKNKNR